MNNYNELVQMCQNQEISWLKFASLTEEKEYQLWLNSKGVKACDSTAKEFIESLEQRVMISQYVNL